MGITIGRGQTVRSLRAIQKDASYIIHYSRDTNRLKTPSLSTVKRIMDDLKMKQLIDYKMVQQGMLITINNYDYLSSTPITKMVHQDLSKVEQPKRPKNEGPQWMFDEGLL
ncbi:hypothetical protein GWN26_09075 [Candidatus Saccharibacteria bacterium]|nr:hypothetical protein [Candidatus Saccharibacteria bacterium]NIV03932.1 hypothetical protein [Calditrichia bacterium]NIV72289.1 hypothetical protein [Calditrichia bacterium]NIV99271.1 hypothetical protein [Candidatus Saccharibacteria bacterium]